MFNIECHDSMPKGGCGVYVKDVRLIGLWGLCIDAHRLHQPSLHILKEIPYIAA